MRQVYLRAADGEQCMPQGAPNQFQRRGLLPQAIDPRDQQQRQDRQQHAGEQMQRPDQALVPESAPFAILFDIAREERYEIPEQAAQHQPHSGDEQGDDQVPGDQSRQVDIAGQARHRDTQHGQRYQQGDKAYHSQPVALGAMLPQAGDDQAALAEAEVDGRQQAQHEQAVGDHREGFTGDALPSQAHQQTEDAADPDV